MIALLLFPLQLVGAVDVAVERTPDDELCTVRARDADAADVLAALAHELGRDLTGLESAPPVPPITVELRRTSSIVLASPKSMIFTSFSRVKNRFAVLMSRCTMRCSWAYWSPAQTWIARRATSRAPRRPRWSWIRLSGIPSSSSMVMW